MAEEVNQFFNQYQIKHIASTPYHPQTNGMVESMHRMLNHAITCAVDGDPSRWDEEIGNAVFALRVRNHAVTKSSPFKLLYGIEPRLIGDINTPRQFRAPLTEREEQVLIYERNADELGLVLVPPEEGNIDRYLGTLDLDIGKEVKLDDDLYYKSSHSPGPTALDALLVPFP